MDQSSEIQLAETLSNTFVPAKSSFKDVPESHWAVGAIAYVTEQNLFQGIGDNNFSPDESMTRAMVATILHRMAGEPNGTAVLTDVAADAWYADAASWSVSEGLLIPAGDWFVPEANTTREGLVYALYQYAGGKPVSVDALSAFEDGDAVSSWAKDAMNWAVFNGFITGMGDGTLAPNRAITRAEVAALLTRFAPRV